MSRRRREQKDRKRELARQMGVKASDAVDELREKLRVTRLELSASAVHLDEAPFALRPAPLAVDIAVALIEPQGVRWLAAVRAAAEGKPKAGVVLPLTHDAVDDDRVRYARPATLVLLAAAAGETPLFDRPAAEVRVSLGGPVSLVDDAVRRLKAPTETTVDDVPAGIAVFPVPHRLKTTVQLPFADGKRRGRLQVELGF
jgi:hypothetical protein